MFFVDPTTNIGDESDHVTFRKTHVVLPYTLKVNAQYTTHLDILNLVLQPAREHA